jgi:hypothetical protein
MEPPIKITVADFVEYVLGWLGSDQISADELSIQSMKAVLHNSLSMISDYQDGIEAMIERREFNKKLIDNGHNADTLLATPNNNI